MKRLLLLRHAKAEQAGADDHARKLTERGRTDAAHIGAWLHNHYVIDLVLCSTSARTRETWRFVAEQLGGKNEAEFLKPLYLAPVATIMKLVQRADDRAQTMMIVGHNPGIEEASAILTRLSQGKDERRRLEATAEKFPTAALAVLEFEVGHWRDAASNSGALAAFVRPKDLD